MFTGIIEEVGVIAELICGSEPDGGARLVVRAPLALQDGSRGPKLLLGESIAEGLVGGLLELAAQLKQAQEIGAEFSHGCYHKARNERPALGSTMPEVLKAIGLMSGTSLDGIDAAIL